MKEAKLLGKGSVLFWLFLIKSTESQQNQWMLMQPDSAQEQGVDTAFLSLDWETFYLDSSSLPPPHPERWAFFLHQE